MKEIIDSGEIGKLRTLIIYSKRDTFQLSQPSLGSNLTFE